MIERIDLDHVAVAAECQPDAWPRYAGDLAGEWLGGGETVGFASAQVQYANGMKLEVLEPFEVERNDFLRRFLDASGPGPHHLTFKVADLGHALAEAEAAGLSPVGVDRSDPSWEEAFLHPKQAHGVVVQLAASAGSDDWGSDRPAGLPRPKRDRPASLDRVVHGVADLDAALTVFRDLLGGSPLDEGQDEGRRFVELGWSGPGRVRLVAVGADGLGGRPGRVMSVDFSVDDPGSVPGAVPLDGDRYEVPADDNLGLRLRLSPLR